MKTKFSFLVVTLCLVSSGFSQKKWTLKECVDHALENNISIQQNLFNLEIAEEDVEIANGSFLPGVNASSNAGINAGLSPDNLNVLRNTTNLNTNFGISARGTIFNGFRNTNAYKQTKLGVESSKLDLEQMQNSISLFVVNGYLNVLFAQENLNVAKVQAEISKKQVVAAKIRYEEGLIPKGDYLNSQSTAANDAQNVVTQENALTIALLNLSQLLQIPSEGFDVQPEQIGDIEDLLIYGNSKEVFEKALTNQPNIKNAELEIENADLNIELAKGAYLPTLTYGISAGSSYFNQFNNLELPSGGMLSNDNFFSQINDRFQYGASLSLQIPIFNRLQTKNRVERSTVSKKLSELNLENEKLQLEQTIEQALVDAKAAAKTYEAAKISLEFQKETFKNALDRFNLGAMTIFDFDLVRNRLVNAESTLIRSKYDYVFKIKVLEFYYYGETKLN